MSPQDTLARNRVMVMSLCRLLGIASLMFGMLLVAERLHVLPVWTGYLFIINGLADIFIIPQILARKWRTPRDG